MSKYYNIKRINATNAIYRMIIGQRSNGKTYSWAEQSLIQYIKNGDKCAYIRRFDIETTPKNLSDLFTPHNIEKISNGKWNSTEYRNRAFTLCLKNDGEIIERDSEPFCLVFALNTWESSKGADKGYVKSICFDEFMTRRAYLPQEFVIFQNILSSIIRDRDNVVIYMLANTVNKYCPYFIEMGLNRIEDMKQGDIDIYKYGDSELTVAVEYCAESENTKNVKKIFAFSNPQLNMITSGTWELSIYPHLTDSIHTTDIAKKFYIHFNKKLICGDIIHKNKQLFIHYHPHTGNHIPNENDIVYVETPDGYILHCKYLKDCPTELHKIIRELILNEREFYSDNETGEMIRNWKLNALKIK